jgi:vacuolar-type H+-ATPase subunit I/STV1
MSDIADWEAKYKHLQQSQAGETRKVQQLAEKNRELERKLNKLAMYENQEQAIKQRLQAVEQAYTSKVKSLELSHYAQRKAWETGVSYELIENYKFEDTNQIDQHIGKLAAFIEAKRQSDFNAQLMSSSKPQAGMDVPRNKPVDAVAKLVAQATGKNLDNDF